MDMVERCAKAAYEAWIANVRELEMAWDELPRDHIERLMDAQRAAIAAMRKPTPEMLDAGANEFRLLRIDNFEQEVWDAMIDAALTSSEKV